jgi:predicted HicB family RNase H-like nuclease
MAKKQGEKTRPPGRPERAGEPSKMVGVRLTDSERKAYAVDAKRRGLTLSQWIRAALEAFLKRRSK